MSTECPRGCGYECEASQMSSHTRACWFPRTIERLREIAGSTTQADDECWPYKRYVSYGRNKGGYVHRQVLELKLGRPIAAGLEACHTCDNPPCFNPAHLYEGTRSDNVNDQAARGRHHGWPHEAAAEGRRNSPKWRGRKPWTGES